MTEKESLDAMRDEAYRRQDNLAADIDELLDRVNPRNAVARWKNELRQSVSAFSEAADEKSPVPLPVAVAGGVVGLVVIVAGVAGASALSARAARRRTPVARLERAVGRAGRTATALRKDAGKAAASARKDAGKAAVSAKKDAGKAAASARKDAGKAAASARKRAAKVSASATKDAGKALRSARTDVGTAAGRVVAAVRD